MAKTETIVQLDPAKVLAEDNIRYGLLPHRVDAMAESILNRGGVMVPVEVQKLTDPNKNGYTHKLTAGFIRHAAALKLNTESGAGLTLPAIVREPSDAKDRRLRQLSENLDRENLSPMDTAVAIKTLMDSGMSRGDIRKLFQRAGGRKGNVMQPASNSFLNIHLSFLELPKSIQAKIHDGRLGVAGAMQLVKAPAEQREAILMKAEEARIRAIDREEKDEERESKGEEKAGAREAKLKELTDAADKAEAAESEAKAKMEAARAAQVEASKVPENYLTLPEAEKKVIAERMGGAKTELREAEKAWGKAHKDAANLRAKANKAANPEPSGAPLPGDKEPAPVKAKAAPAPAKKAAVGPKEVAKAAKEAGVQAKPVPLTAQDGRIAATDLSKSKLAKVKAIGSIVVKLLAGELTTKQAESELSLITGEHKEKEEKTAKAKK